MNSLKSFFGNALRVLWRELRARLIAVPSTFPQSCEGIEPRPGGLYVGVMKFNPSTDSPGKRENVRRVKPTGTRHTVVCFENDMVEFYYVEAELLSDALGILAGSFTHHEKMKLCSGSVKMKAGRSIIESHPFGRIVHLGGPFSPICQN